MIFSSRLPLNDAVEWWASLRLPSSLGAHLPLSEQALLPSDDDDALERTAQLTPLGIPADACRRARRPSVPTTPLEDDDDVTTDVVIVVADIGIEWYRCLFRPKVRTKEGCIYEGKKVTQSMYSHHLYKGKNGMMKRDIFGLSLTKKTLGDFGGRRRQMEPRAFVDRFSTLVIQQLFWGTRVYRTSPLKN